jgi:hypothetical protein
MEPTQGKAATKRRRWLIVMFVLGLVSMAAWWFWPRGDARFIGKWTYTYDGELDGAFAFRRNGILEIYGVGVSVDGTTGEEHRLISTSRFFGTWRVVADRLVVGDPEPSPVVNAVLEFIDSYCTLPWLIEGFDSRIVNASNDEITLEVPDGMRMILKRMPE